MIKVTTYINFDGKCKEAMTYYNEILGGDLELMPLGDNPMPGKTEEMKDMIMHSSITKDGVALVMASDSMGYPLNVGTNVSVCLSGDLDDITNAYNKFAADGKIGMPLKSEFFGTYGDLVDKFGVRWMFQSDQKQA